MAEELRALVEQARRGDRGAFGRLVRSCQRRVYATAYRMMGNHHDADDVVQESFVRAYRALAGFDARADFTTWLYRIVINVALNHLRGQTRRRRTALAVEEVQITEASQAGSDPRKALEHKRAIAALDEALHELSDSLRAAVVVVLIEGMSHREAAEVLEVSEGTVAWRIHEARQQLRRKLAAFLSPPRAENRDGQPEPKAVR